MSDLNQLRLEINEITLQMVELFEKRLDVSKEVAAYKKANNLPIYQPEREKQVIEMYTKDAKYPELTKMFLESLMTFSKELQKEENK